MVLDLRLFVRLDVRENIQLFCTFVKIILIMNKFTVKKQTTEHIEGLTIGNQQDIGVVGGGCYQCLN